MFNRLKEYFTKDNLDYEFLPPALEIEETPSSPVHRLLIWLIFFMSVAVFIWSYFGRVDEVAVARGKVIPDGRIKVIQTMETGIIRAIHVKEGQQVKEGQVLIELDPTIKQADAESAERILSMHKSDKERLISELNGEGQKATDDGQEAREMLQFQRKLKEARESEFRAREETLKSVISQRKNAVLAAKAILTKLQKTYTILKEQEGMLGELYKEELTSKMALLDKQKELYSTEQEIEAQNEIIKQAGDGLDEAIQNLDALVKERKRTILSDLVDKEKDITAVKGEAIKAKKKYDLEYLRSPVNGTVHGLSAFTIGGVVTSAEPIVTIVPEGTPLIVEATALNKDIGFIKMDQEAEIKLDTFPFQKYGTIKARVVSISPDAFDDEKLGPVYKIKVQPDKTNLMINGREVPLSPGMTVSAEVKTGKRRIIEFFLSPIVKYSKESLTLR